MVFFHKSNQFIFHHKNISIFGFVRHITKHVKHHRINVYTHFVFRRQVKIPAVIINIVLAGIRVFIPVLLFQAAWMSDHKELC